MRQVYNETSTPPTPQKQHVLSDFTQKVKVTGADSNWI